MFSMNFLLHGESPTETNHLVSFSKAGNFHWVDIVTV
jgi:hypothetical protein